MILGILFIEQIKTNRTTKSLSNRSENCDRFKMEYSVISCHANKKDYPDILLFPMPKQDDLRKAWLQRCGIYPENPLPTVLANKLLYVCQKHFDVSIIIKINYINLCMMSLLQPSDYRVVKVNAKHYSQRSLLSQDVLPHRNIPHQAGAEKFFFMMPDKDPLMLPECCYDDMDLSTETNEKKRKKESDGETTRTRPQLIDRSVTTDEECRCSVAVQCSVETADRHTQTGNTDIFHKPSIHQVASK